MRALSKGFRTCSIEEMQRHRDDLLHQASIGKITGEQADAEAERMGVGRLSCRPDATVFNPLNERHWTIVMAVAWIAYRTADAVREAWYWYREECMDWTWQRWRSGPEGEIFEGWHLKQRDHPNIALLTFGADYDAAQGVGMVMTVTAARAELWKALAEGGFEAGGISEASQRWMTIPALEWGDLVPTVSHDGRDELCFGLMGSGYKDVRLVARDVRNLWPALVPERVDLPTLVPPTGEGYMPLYCVAQWIASEGGQLDFDPEDQAVWRGAFQSILDKATANKLCVVGTRDGLREQVPGFQFVTCAVEYPFREPGPRTSFCAPIHIWGKPSGRRATTTR